MNRFSKSIILSFGLALASAQPSSSQANQAAIDAECGLLKLAYSETKKAVGAALPDILVGCPGYENLKETMTRRESSKAFRKAAGTKVPEHAAQYGKMGKILFQRMIARGVPPEVAVKVSDTSTYRKAVAAYQ